ncbi:hypothetical protein SEVIR_2G239350v4 [Setaria viridis]
MLHCFACTNQAVEIKSEVQMPKQIQSVAKEINHSIHQLSRLAAAVVGDEEAVPALGLEALELPAPPAVPNGVAVRPPPRRPRVLRRRGDQQPLASQLRQARRAGRHRVYAGVVEPAVRAGEDDRPPVLVRLPELLVLSFHLLFTSEGRVEQDHAFDARRCSRSGAQAADARGDGHVMGDVRAGADSGQEDPAEVAVVRQPRVGAGRHPAERGPGVVVGRREPVLRREAVADGDGDDAGGGGERIDVAVEQRVVGRADDKVAAVEEDEDRELRRRRRRGRGRLDGWGEVEPRGDAGGRVDSDVLGGDAGLGVEAGGRRVRDATAVDVAVLVQPEVRAAVDNLAAAGVHRPHAAGASKHQPIGTAPRRADVCECEAVVARRRGI